jgi:hypothetical protein
MQHAAERTNHAISDEIHIIIQSYNNGCFEVLYDECALHDASFSYLLFSDRMVSCQSKGTVATLQRL